jgi:hypothetical protein
MAKISTSVLIGGIAGTAGTVTVSNPPTGKVAKTKKRATTSQTPAQLLERQKLAALTAAWNAAVLAGYGPGWNSLALANPTQDKLHQWRPLSARSFFNKANRCLQTLALPLILAPPAVWSCLPPGIPALQHDIGPPEDFLVTPPSAPSSGQALVVSACPRSSPGRTTTSHTSKIIKVLNSPGPPPWDILPYYLAIFLRPNTGQRVTVTIWYVDTTSGCQSTKDTASLIW